MTFYLFSYILITVTITDKDFMKSRYSKQRELVYNLLKNTKSHPTAEWVYERAREIDPTISLGTVYRNLKYLCESGAIISLETADSKIHYDACVDCHGHFVCERCGKIYDFDFDFAPPKSLLDQGFKVAYERRICYGICAECAKND